MATNDERRQRGLDVYKEMGWGENEGVKELDPDLWACTTDFLFGDIWSRPGLNLRERELVTIGVLMASQSTCAMHTISASPSPRSRKSSCKAPSISACRKACSPCAS